MPRAKQRNLRRAFRTRPSCSRSQILVYQGDFLNPAQLSQIDESGGFFTSFKETSILEKSVVNFEVEKPPQRRKGEKVALPADVLVSSDSEESEAISSSESGEEEDVNEFEKEAKKLEEKFESDEEFSLYYEDADGQRLMDWNGKLIPFDENLYAQKKNRKKAEVPAASNVGKGKKVENKKKSEKNSVKKSDKLSAADKQTPSKPVVDEGRRKTALDFLRMSLARAQAKSPHIGCTTPQKSFVVFTGNNTSAGRTLRHFNFTQGLDGAKENTLKPSLNFDEDTSAATNLGTSFTNDNVFSSGDEAIKKRETFAVPKGRLRLSRLSPIRRDSRMMYSSPIQATTPSQRDQRMDDVASNVRPQMCSTPINTATLCTPDAMKKADFSARPLACSTPTDPTSSAPKSINEDDVHTSDLIESSIEVNTPKVVPTVHPAPPTTVLPPMPIQAKRKAKSTVPMSGLSTRISTRTRRRSFGLTSNAVDPQPIQPISPVQSTVPASTSSITVATSRVVDSSVDSNETLATSLCKDTLTTSEKETSVCSPAPLPTSLKEQSWPANTEHENEDVSMRQLSEAGGSRGEMPVAQKTAGEEPGEKSCADSRYSQDDGMSADYSSLPSSESNRSSDNKRRSGSGLSSSDAQLSLPIGKRRRTSVTGNSRPCSRADSVPPTAAVNLPVAVDSVAAGDREEKEDTVVVPSAPLASQRLSINPELSIDDELGDNHDVMDSVGEGAEMHMSSEEDEQVAGGEKQPNTTASQSSEYSDIAAILDQSLNLSRFDENAPVAHPNATLSNSVEANVTMNVQNTLQLEQDTLQNTLSATLMNGDGRERAATRCGMSLANATALSNMTNMSMMSQYGGRTRNVTQMCNQTVTKRNTSLMRNESDLMDGGVVLPFYLSDYTEEDGSDLSQLLHIIQQKGIWRWEDLPKDVFENPRKLGEGVYGEVYATTYDGQPTAMKVIPFNGDEITYTGLVNGETLWEAGEIIPEILITRELSGLYDPTGSYSTPNFIRLLKANVVQGPYHESLLAAWDEFAERKDSENDRPSIYASDRQLQLTIGLAMGGVDLESFQLKNENQVISVLLQTALSLLIAEQVLQFEHRDLHIGNILAAEQKEDVRYRYDGDDVVIKSHGVKINIIDFTLSRLHKSGTTIFRDLEPDEELFAGEGYYQFDIYRMMRAYNKGDWNKFEPKSNVFWLHYLAKELIEVKKCKKAITKKRKAELMEMFNKILDFQSLQELFTSPVFSDLLQKYLVKT